MESGRVLCVDDERDIRDLLRHVLEDEGYEVRTAPNGAEALAVLERWRPALVLLDINMPVMNGYEFARAYRERGRVILIADDDAGVRDMLAALLRDEGYEPVTAADGEPPHAGDVPLGAAPP